MNKRKIISVLVLLFIVSGLITGKNVNAEELTVIKTTEEGFINPSAYTVCGDYTSHYMVTKGTGYVSGPKGYIIAGGACFQCKRCNLVFISEGDPLNVNGYNNTIGHYITYKINYPISDYGASLDTSYTSVSQLPYCGSGKLSGYTFRLQ